MTTRRTAILLGVLAIVLLVAGEPAHAQNAGGAVGAVLDGVVASFQTQSAQWDGRLRAYALACFATLALIDFAWAAIRLAMRGADFSEFMAELVGEIMFLGFFALLLQTSMTWGPAIVNSFRRAAQNASGTATMLPSDIFAAGVKVAGQVADKVSWATPGADVGLAISALVIVACFALIAAWIICALVESYIILNAAVIFLGFGGSRWTSDIAISTIRYAFSVGAKLFIMQLLAGIGTGIIQQMANNFNDVTTQGIFTTVGVSITLFAMLEIVPKTIQAMINGTSVAHGGALVGAAAGVAGGVAAVGAGVAGAAAGTGALGFQAGKLGATELGGSIRAGTAPTSKAGRAASMLGSALKGAGSAINADLGRRLSGQGSRHGVAGFRMAADLSNRTRLIREDIAKPRPTEGGAPRNTISSDGAS